MAIDQMGLYDGEMHYWATKMIFVLGGEGGGDIPVHCLRFVQGVLELSTEGNPMLSFFRLIWYL